MSQDWFKVAQMAGIRKGSIVRSYDFMHTNETYVLGEVVDIGPVEGSKGHLAVHIKGIKQVMDGRETPLYGQMYYPFLMHMQERQWGDENLGPGIVLLELCLLVNHFLQFVLTIRIDGCERL